MEQKVSVVLLFIIINTYICITTQLLQREQKNRETFITIIPRSIFKTSSMT